jgi:hypothetical protein
MRRACSNRHLPFLLSLTNRGRNKSLDASRGSVFRIKRDPKKLLDSGVARSTQPFYGGKFFEVSGEVSYEKIMCGGGRSNDSVTDSCGQYKSAGASVSDNSCAQHMPCDKTEWPKGPMANF